MERRRVDIGGAVLEAELSGAGRVTVVFENGLGTSLDEWDAVVPRVASGARVVRYDRRRASSSGSLQARTAADMAIDLEKLLAALAVAPPYLLVGHSWGGVVARVFAHTHPSSVAGLVFVDATHEVADSRGFALLPLIYSLMGLAARTAGGRRWILKQICPAGAPPAYRARVDELLRDRQRWAISLRTARAEAHGIRSSLQHVRTSSPDLPSVPIHVLTAGGVTGPNVKAIRRVHDAWQAAVARAPLARYTNVPESGHQLPLERPEAVISAVLGVLDAIGGTTAEQPT
jgi:pimeloyl-ACP methyl ester carboxylesterase